MKLALLSDIHGNLTALDAVLADIQARGGVDQYIVVGDIVALGPDPVGVLERLTALANVAFVRGNTDRYVAFGDRPPPTLAEVRADPGLLPRLVEIAGSFAWTQGVVTATGWLPWLKQLPLELSRVLPDGTRMLCVHASPGRDDGSGIVPEMSDAEIELLVRKSAAELVCVGHTHRPLKRRVGTCSVVNLGSVGIPPSAELRASYVLLEVTPAGYDVEHCLVDYDRGAVIEALEQLGHPGAGWIIEHLRGERRL